jgi:hypothetical protein
VKRKFGQPTKQPAQADPVEGWKITPEFRSIIAVCKNTKRLANLFSSNSQIAELGTNIFESPEVRMRPVDFTTLGIKFTRILRHKTDGDQVYRVGPLNELGINPIFHSKHIV